METTNFHGTAVAKQSNSFIDWQLADSQSFYNPTPQTTLDSFSLTNIVSIGQATWVNTPIEANSDFNPYNTTYLIADARPLPNSTPTATFADPSVFVFLAAAISILPPLAVSLTPLVANCLTRSWRLFVKAIRQPDGLMSLEFSIESKSKDSQKSSQSEKSQKP